VSYESMPHTTEIGSLHSDNKTFLKYACTDGYVLVFELQLAGITRMKIADFLRGNKVVCVMSRLTSAKI
jgi:methionyl-tRNA formyltransferase